MTIEYSQPSTPRKWYQIWLQIWTEPGETSFQALLNEPDHRMSRGFIWVAVASLIVILITGISATRELGNIVPGFSGTIGYYLCFVILSPIFAVIGLMISSGIYHLLAKIFSANGTWNDLVICTSAVAAPSGLIGGLISVITFLLVRIPFAAFIPWGLSVIFGIYAVVLYILAIKSAEKTSTGKAVLIYFIPVIVIGLLVLCSFIALTPVFRTSG